MRLRGIVVPLAAVALLGAACGGGEDGGGNGGGEAVATDTVSAIDNEFEPQNVLVEADSTLTVTNDGQAAHTFTVEDGSIDETLQPGDSVDVDIALEAGDHPFVCTFHPGMEGTLTVQ